MAETGYPDDDELFDALQAQNPWWSGGGVPRELRPEFKRADHAEMLRRLDGRDYEHHVHALVGARRVGKTTVLYQLVDKLVSRVDPRRVMFASLDDEALFPGAGNLRRILSLYSRRVLASSRCAGPRRGHTSYSTRSRPRKTDRRCSRTSSTAAARRRSPCRDRRAPAYSAPRGR